MTLATKDTILQSQDWDVKTIEIEKWGTLRIRALTAQERLELIERYGDGSLTNDAACTFFCMLIALSVIDEQGNQIFDLNGDVAHLKAKSWGRIQEAATAIMEFNAMLPAASQEMVKN